MWTFGRKIAPAFVLSSPFLVAIGAVAHRNVELLPITRHLITRVEPAHLIRPEANA